MITRDQVEELAASFGWAYDTNDVDLLRGCFAAEATYEVDVLGSPVLDPLSGRDAIVDFIAQTRASQTDQRRHVLTNFVTLAETAESRSVRAYMTLLAVDDAGTHLNSTGVYEFDVVSEEGRPRFSRFKLSLDRPF